MFALPLLSARDLCVLSPLSIQIPAPSLPPHSHSPETPFTKTRWRPLPVHHTVPVLCCASGSHGVRGAVWGGLCTAWRVIRWARAPERVSKSLGPCPSPTQAGGCRRAQENLPSERRPEAPDRRAGGGHEAGRCEADPAGREGCGLQRGSPGVPLRPKSTLPVSLSRAYLTAKRQAAPWLQFPARPLSGHRASGQPLLLALLPQKVEARAAGHTGGSRRRWVGPRMPSPRRGWLRACRTCHRTEGPCPLPRRSTFFSFFLFRQIRLTWLKSRFCHLLAL